MYKDFVLRCSTNVVQEGSLVTFAELDRMVKGNDGLILNSVEFLGLYRDDQTSALLAVFQDSSDDFYFVKF